MKSKKSKYIDMIVVILCNSLSAKKDHVFARGKVVSEDFTSGKLQVRYKASFNTISNTTSGWFSREHVFAALDTVEIIE